MKEDSPVKDVDIVCFETAGEGQTVLLGGAAHSPKVQRLCISSMLMRGDSSAYSSYYGKVLATTKTLKTFALHRINNLNVDALLGTQILPFSEIAQFWSLINNFPEK